MVYRVFCGFREYKVDEEAELVFHVFDLVRASRGKDNHGRTLPSAPYVARLVAPDRTETQRLMLIK